MKIDAHVHYTPPSLKARLSQLADDEPYWHLLLNPPNGRSIQGWVTAETMIRDMDANGLDKVVLVGEYFRQHENCVQRNNQAIEIVHRWPDRVLALATIQPNAGQIALDELDRCLDKGLVGVGELNPYAQGFRLDDPAFLRLAERCIERDVPINLHVSEEVGGYYLGKSTTPLRHYYELACRLPDLKLVLAHWGGGLFLYEMMPRVRRQLRNVWYDTAATPLLYPVENIFTTALTCIDHRKLLHGSDYPLRIYPRTMKTADFQPFLTAMENLTLDETVRADVMGRNAARLFGLLDDGIDHRAAIKPLRPKAQPTNEITTMMTVDSVLRTWPEAEPIFAEYKIPTRDQTVPSWEPIL
ncbi:MAG: amidohydrolase family protein, partial [Chloroflexota bacterium]